jgi:ABC-type Mn2+/Zn2+ transport system permease subunit
MTALFDWLAEPLGYQFIVRAMGAAVLVGMVSGILGAYVVLRGMAFMGDALAHAILPGVVIAFLAGWPLAIGALLMGMATAGAIGALSGAGRFKEDTAIGVVFAGAFALGVALLSAAGSYTVDLAHFLFGNLLGVSAADLWIMAGLGGIVLLTIFLFYKELMVVSFDPVLAASLRLPIGFLRYLLLMLLAVTIVVSLQVVGVALVMAMLVTPAAAASLVARRLPALMATSAAIGALAGLVGVYASYYLDVAGGPAVVLVATSIFLAFYLFAPSRGLLSGLIRRPGTLRADGPAD